MEERKALWKGDNGRFGELGFHNDALGEGRFEGKLKPFGTASSGRKIVGKPSSRG